LAATTVRGDRDALAVAFAFFFGAVALFFGVVAFFFGVVAFFFGVVAFFFGVVAAEVGFVARFRGVDVARRFVVATLRAMRGA
jgi:hypothetical protein